MHFLRNLCSGENALKNNKHEIHIIIGVSPTDTKVLISNSRDVNLSEQINQFFQGNPAGSLDQDQGVCDRVLE